MEFEYRQCFWTPLWTPHLRYPWRHMNFLGGSKTGGRFLLKSVAAVALCSAACFALHRCHRWFTREVAPPPLATNTSSAPLMEIRRKAKRNLRIVTVPGPSRESTVSPFTPPLNGFSLPKVAGMTRSWSTNVEKVNFADSELDDGSNDLLQGCDKDGPLVLLNYKAVVVVDDDEVSADADDESSEPEDEASRGTAGSSSPEALNHTDISDQEIPHDPGKETSKSHLTFESELGSRGTDPPSELMCYGEEDSEVMGKSIVMNLPHHPPLSGYVKSEDTTRKEESQEGCLSRIATAVERDEQGFLELRGARLRPRTIHLEHIAEQDEVVVTKAVVIVC